MSKKPQKNICPHCSYSNEDDALTCSMCSGLLRKEENTGESASEQPPTLSAAPALGNQEKPGSFHILGIPRPWFYLLLGLLLVPVFNVHWMPRYMLWFIEALIHEMGHSITAWFFGCPAVPKIRLDGYAAAEYVCQSLFLTLVVWGGLIAAFVCFLLEPDIQSSSKTMVLLTRLLWSDQ